MKKLQYSVAASGCHEFAGCKLSNGYGKIGRNGKTWLAHRLAWSMLEGPIPEGLCVLHSCDNRCCINVNHLFLGTRADNMQDMIAKGRARFTGFTSPNYCRPTPKQGERNGRAKLTIEQVQQIRQCQGEIARDIAPRFNISMATVQRILSGNGWHAALAAAYNATGAS